MAQKTAIMEIIKGLDRSQSTFVRARLRGQKRRLYDFYSSSKNPENIADAQAATGKSGNALASLKLKLESEVVASLGEYTRKRSPMAAMRAAMDLMDGYLACGKPALAATQLRNAFSLARQIEDFAVCRALMQTNDLYFASSAVALDPESREKVLALAREHAMCEDLYHAAEQLKRLPPPEMPAAASSLQSQMSEAAPPQGHKASMYHMRATIICLVIQRKLEACIPQCLAIQHRWETQRFLLHDPTMLGIATAALNVHAALEQQAGNAAVAHSHARLLVEALHREGVNLPAGLTLFQLLLDLSANYGDTRPQPTDILLQRLREVVDGPATDEKRLANLLIVAAGVLISQNRYRPALDWLRQMYKRRRTELYEVWSAIAALMELCCHFAMADYEELLLCVRRAKRRLAAANVGEAFMDAVTRAFTRLGEEPQSSKVQLQQLAESLATLGHDPSAQLLMDGFDLRGWAQQAGR